MLGGLFPMTCAPGPSESPSFAPLKNNADSFYSVRSLSACVALSGACHAHSVLRSPLRHSATDQESGLHANGNSLACAWHRSHHGGFQRNQCRAVEPVPLPGGDRIVRMTLTSKSSPDFWAELNGPQLRQLRELPIIQNVLAMDYHHFTLTGTRSRKISMRSASSRTVSMIWAYRRC